MQTDPTAVGNFVLALPWQAGIQLVFMVAFTIGIVEAVKRVKWINKLISPNDRIYLLNVVVAWVLCRGSDFGVLARLVELGSASRPWLPYVDYFGTACFIAMLAGMGWDKLASMLETFNAKKMEARARMQTGRGFLQ